MVKVGLTVDLSGTVKELHDLCALLKKYAVKGTFFVSGRACRKEYLTLLIDEEHEIANHTHPSDLTQLQVAQQREEIVRAHEAIAKICTQQSRVPQPKGFRSPYYVFNEGFINILSELGYFWDSSKAFFPALGKPFRSENFGTLVEIPSLFPDDSILLNKLVLELDDVKKIWIEAFQACKEYFVWGVHPYVIVRGKKRSDLLEAFLQYLKDSGAEFVSLSEIAESMVQVSRKQ